MDPTPEAVPIHDWQREELSRRKARLLANPNSRVSWEEVKRRIRSRYGPDLETWRLRLP
jgi:putative addiction module component (TIGR02574 family)